MSKFKKINKEDVAAAQAKKKQRKIILRVLGAVVLLAVAVTAVVYFVPKKNGGFGFEQTKTYFEVRGFLKDIIAEDLDSAVENIWFFDNEENLENGTELSEEEAQNVWKKRVAAQKNGEYANYIEDFSDLKVYKKDGVFYASVKLHTRERGVASYRTATLRFANGKIYTVADYSTEQLNPLEKALSGYLGE